MKIIVVTPRDFWNLMSSPTFRRISPYEGVVWGEYVVTPIPPERIPGLIVAAFDRVIAQLKGHS